jgi:hypothetical protein
MAPQSGAAPVRRGATADKCSDAAQFHSTPQYGSNMEAQRRDTIAGVRAITIV